MSHPKTRADQDPQVLAFGTLLDVFRGLETALASDLRRRSGLSHTWFDALIRIACEPEKVMNMGELCDATSLSSGGATRLVDRLVEVGYVERRPSPKDRRVQLVALTLAGAQALDEAAEFHSENIRQHFTAKLTESELQLFLELLEKIRVGGPSSSEPTTAAMPGL